MARDPETFIIHPESGVAYTVPETAKIVGVRDNIIYGRLGRGDQGMQIWRPPRTKACTVQPGIRGKEDIKRVKYKKEEKYYV